MDSGKDDPPGILAPTPRNHVIVPLPTHRSCSLANRNWLAVLVCSGFCFHSLVQSVDSLGWFKDMGFRIVTFDLRFHVMGLRPCGDGESSCYVLHKAVLSSAIPTSHQFDKSALEFREVLLATSLSTSRISRC